MLVRAQQRQALAAKDIAGLYNSSNPFPIIQNKSQILFLELKGEHNPVYVSKAKKSLQVIPWKQRKGTYWQQWLLWQNFLLSPTFWSLIEARDTEVECLQPATRNQGSLTLCQVRTGRGERGQKENKKNLYGFGMTGIVWQIWQYLLWQRLSALGHLGCFLQGRPFMMCMDWTDVQGWGQKTVEDKWKQISMNTFLSVRCSTSMFFNLGVMIPMG